MVELYYKIKNWWFFKLQRLHTKLVCGKEYVFILGKLRIEIIIVMRKPKLLEIKLHMFAIIIIKSKYIAKYIFIMQRKGSLLGTGKFKFTLNLW